MEFSSVFIAPVFKDIAGQRVDFAVLVSDELGPIAAEIRADRIKRAEDNAARRNLKPVETYRAVESVEHEVTVSDIEYRLRTVPGAGQALNLSLIKAGYTVDQAKNIISAIPPMEQTILSLVVTGLHPLAKNIVKKKTAAEGDAISRPLSEGGAEQPTGTPSSIDSASTNPA